MKKIFKYKLINMWLILGFSVAFIVFIYRMQGDIIKNSETVAMNSSAFSYITSMRLETIDGAENENLTQHLHEYLHSLCREDAVVLIDEMHFETKPNFSNIENVVICVSDEVPRFLLHEGEYPSKEQLLSEDGFAVLPYSLKSEVYVENNREYIDYNGESFEVTGYISKDSEWLVRDRMLLFAGENNIRIWELMAGYLNDGALYVSIYNDGLGPLSEKLEEFDAQARMISCESFYVQDINDAKYSILAETHYDYSNIPTKKQKQYTTFVYIFVVIMLCFVVEFWVKLRNSEFITLRKNGFSIYYIFLKIYKELLLACSIGAILGTVINLLFTYHVEGYIEYSLDRLYSYFSLSILFILITVLLASLLSVGKLFIRYIMKKDDGVGL